MDSSLSSRAICAGMPPSSTLDLSRFDQDRTDQQVADRILRDVSSGAETGEVLGTPMLFIDGVVHRGAYDAATLTAVLAG
jgi:protein-disulfide isomerase